MPHWRLLDAAARRARRQRARLSARSGAGLILLYHRIAEPEFDPWQIAVSPATFDRHLRFLGSEYRLLSLPELVACARRGSIPERAVAITFDDGYADNLHLGLPLLEKHGVPATIYIATDYIGSPRQFWWDELDDLVTGPGERPGSLDLSLGKRRVVAQTSTEADRRGAALSVLHSAFRASPPLTIESGLDQLRAWAGASYASGGRAGSEEARRPMSREELVSLGESDLIELGAHTAHHPSMLALTRDLGRAEVESSRRFLAEATGIAPAGFSFPFGHNSPESRRIVRSCGFDHAVGVRWDTPLTAAARRYELPRLMVVEESEDALAARMEDTLAFRGQPAG